MSRTTLKKSDNDSHSSPNFRLISTKDIEKEPSEDWQVSDVFIAKGLACIYGNSGTGKTFLAIDLALSICTGKDWLGHKTKQAPVTYLYAENHQSAGKRLNAWAKHNQTSLPENFHLIKNQIDIANSAHVEELISLLNQAGKSEGVIVIDTFSAATSGIDENSSKEMGKVIFNLKQLSLDTQSLVILIHHTGKDGTKGIRGHSSLFAALDNVIKVNSESFKIEKNKDGVEGQEYKFKLTSVELDQGVTSCAVTSNSYSNKLQPRNGKNEETILTALKSHLDLTDIKYLSIEDAVDATYNSLTDLVSNKRKHESKNIIKKLIQKGLFTTQEIQGVESILNPKYLVQNPSSPLGGEGVLDISGHWIGYMDKLTEVDWQSQGARH